MRPHRARASEAVGRQMRIRARQRGAGSVGRGPGPPTRPGSVGRGPTPATRPRPPSASVSITQSSPLEHV